MDPLAYGLSTAFAELDQRTNFGPALATLACAPRGVFLAIGTFVSLGWRLSLALGWKARKQVQRPRKSRRAHDKVLDWI